LDAIKSLKQAIQEVLEKGVSLAMPCSSLVTKAKPRRSSRVRSVYLISSFSIRKKPRQQDNIPKSGRRPKVSGAANTTKKKRLKRKLLKALYSHPENLCFVVRYRCAASSFVCLRVQRHEWCPSLRFCKSKETIRWEEWCAGDETLEKVLSCVPEGFLVVFEELPVGEARGLHFEARRVFKKQGDGALNEEFQGPLCAE